MIENLPPEHPASQAILKTTSLFALDDTDNIKLKMAANMRHINQKPLVRHGTSNVRNEPPFWGPGMQPPTWAQVNQDIWPSSSAARLGLALTAADELALHPDEPHGGLVSRYFTVRPARPNAVRRSARRSAERQVHFDSEPAVAPVSSAGTGAATGVTPATIMGSRPRPLSDDLVAAFAPSSVAHATRSGASGDAAGSSANDARPGVSSGQVTKPGAARAKRGKTKVTAAGEVDVPSANPTKRAAPPRAHRGAYTEDEDALIVSLRAGGLHWEAIAQRMNSQFPRQDGVSRTAGGVQVRHSRSIAPRLRSDADYRGRLNDVVQSVNPAFSGPLVDSNSAPQGSVSAASRRGQRQTATTTGIVLRLGSRTTAPTNAEASSSAPSQVRKRKRGQDADGEDGEGEGSAPKKRHTEGGEDRPRRAAGSDRVLRARPARRGGK